MTPAQRKASVTTGAVLAVVGWVGLMISFWLPLEFMRDAMRATALCLLVPGAVTTALVATFWNELLGTGSVPQLRCTDCATKILNPGGTTIGDHIEGELMTFIPPEDSPFGRGPR